MAARTGRGNRNKTTDEIARRFAVTKRQAERLIKQGVSPDNIETIEGAKLKKLRLEGEKLEEQLAILRKEHVPAARIKEEAHRIGAVLQAELRANEVILPPMLAGLSEPEIRQIVRDQNGKILKNFCESVESIT